jgi:hypothetical protein
MKFTRAFLAGALLFLSAGALWGGLQLIVEAHGNPWGFMPLNLLRHTPFHSWLIPGILLLAVNGLLSLWVLWLVLMRRSHYGLWAVFQGFVLLGWLTVECVMLRFVIWPHYLYGGVALALIVAGAAARHESVPAAPAH